MNATSRQSSAVLQSLAEHATALALGLVDAESKLRVLTSGQADAIVDPEGRTYLLRPAQEHLRASEHRLQMLLESVADVIMVVNRSGIILSQHGAARRVLGYLPEEMVSHSIFRFVDADDIAYLYSAFLEVIEGFREIATVQFRHGMRDGSHRLLTASIGKLHDPHSESVVISLRPAI